MRTIALLGGQFDPPHLGHYFAATATLEQVKNVEEVWFLVSYQHPWRKAVASFANRCAMSALMNEKYIKTVPIEKTLAIPSYTINTLRYLFETTKNKYYFIIGSDTELSKWHEYNTLKTMVQFIIVPRPQYPIVNYPENAIVLDKKKTTTTNISSTIIRDRIQKKLLIQGMTDDKVIEYIKKKKLYLNNS